MNAICKCTIEGLRYGYVKVEVIISQGGVSQARRGEDLKKYPFSAILGLQLWTSR